MTAPDRDPWLQCWLPLVHEQAAGGRVLELGCGSGHDTQTLVASGLAVIAIDLSPEAIAGARQRVPAAEFHVQDLRAPFPVAPGSVGVVVASLSLHYFAWTETESLAARIHQTLRPGGLLLCRLNSTTDHHYGASGHAMIDTHFYDVDGQAKRFFDLADLDRLFGPPWRVLSRRTQTIQRYEQPKQVWEIVLEA